MLILAECECDADELPEDFEKRDSHPIEMAVVYINKGMLFQIFCLSF